MAGAVFAGIAKDVMGSISQVLNNVQAYANLFESHKILVVENDSSDGTKEYLQKWAQVGGKRIHIEAEHIKSNTPYFSGPRSEYLANFQNIYMSEQFAQFRNLYLEVVDREDTTSCQYVIIFDCDAVNIRKMNSADVLSAVKFLAESSGRAAVFANQHGYYYDLWALRHKVWCPHDCWQDYDERCRNGLSSEEALKACIGSKQLHIPFDADPIEVESAFGGFAIYKTEFLKGLRYKGTSADGRPTCEHVFLNKRIRERGGRLFIYPPLLNSTQYMHVKRPRDAQYWRMRLGEAVAGIRLSRFYRPRAYWDVGEAR